VALLVVGRCQAARRLFEAGARNAAPCVFAVGWLVGCRMVGWLIVSDSSLLMVGWSGVRSEGFLGGLLGCWHSAV